MPTATRPIRIGNISGFYGDRPSAMREQLEGGSIDVLTGDYLAELTMLILARTREQRPDGGYARTFVSAVIDVLDVVLDRNVKVVVNAGGLDPQGCASAVREAAASAGLHPVVASIAGDDLIGRIPELTAGGERFVNLQTGLTTEEPFATANAYLGGWGITEALRRGADIVITGRVTDAALVSGVAAWWHDWGRGDLDQLAGAVVAGHVIECGLQATGGNYSYFAEIEDLTYPGFPWAEVAADGSCVIGKHEGTGGAINRETVVSQLLYEIGSPAYLNPDVTARFDTLDVQQVGVDRVAVKGARGQAPPESLKVAASVAGGYRNSMTIGLTGTDQAAKAALLHDQVWRVLPYDAGDFDDVVESVIGRSDDDPATNEAGVSFWQLSVASRDEARVGRVFANAGVQTVLGGIPGMFGLTPPSKATPFARYWPTSIARAAVSQVVDIDGVVVQVCEDLPDFESVQVLADPSTPPVWAASGRHERRPLGVVLGARSGDKGGSANLGVYARSDDGYRWLHGYLTVDRLRQLLPETQDLPVDRYDFPNLWAINFMIHGLLGEGVSSSLRLDPQAKGLGEYLRARVVDVPVELLDG